MTTAKQHRCLFSYNSDIKQYTCTEYLHTDISVWDTVFMTEVTNWVVLIWTMEEIKHDS